MHSERNGALVGQGQLKNKREKEKKFCWLSFLLRTPVLEFRKCRWLFLTLDVQPQFHLGDDGQLGKGDGQGSAKLQGSHRSILLKFQLIGNNMT